jgi:hypothetical protein
MKILPHSLLAGEANFHTCWLYPQSESRSRYRSITFGDWRGCNGTTCSSGGCLLADDMGLGKTLQALLFLAWLIEEEEKWQDAAPWNPILIVAPLILLDDDGPWLKDHVSGLDGAPHCTPGHDGNPRTFS